MQSRFIDFIRKNNLVTEKYKILLGVSGGIDSMVMLSLFHKSGFEVVVAHCNFSLRAEESDADEELVVHECGLMGIKLHRIRFDTQKYALDNKLSIQVAARNLRYNWFNSLCSEFGFTKIAIAHNRDDVAETVIINLTRGTGLKGLTGIKATHGLIIRPLLFAGRDEITRFALQNGISYRNDSSNASTKYARNRIRHNVIPELEEINPSAKASIASTAKHVQQAWDLVERYLSDARIKLCKTEGDGLFISIKGLKKEQFCSLFLVEELTPYGFTPDSIEQIVDSLDSQPGKIFYSMTHQLLRDRDNLIITERKELDQTIVTIENDCKSIDQPVKLNFAIIENSESYKIPYDSSMAVIDYDKLIFPLTLRHWQPGDKFVPFGMEGFKKVSDFLIDKKVPLTQKEKVFVLESGDNIVWVVGVRIDDRYKVTKQTKRNWLATCC
ncbi:MAG: tRNA lysidine(34) synthetase TilS [Tenuifilaceae bacterium]